MRPAQITSRPSRTCEQATSKRPRTGRSGARKTPPREPAGSRERPPGIAASPPRTPPSEHPERKIDQPVQSGDHTNHPALSRASNARSRCFSANRHGSIPGESPTPMGRHLGRGSARAARLTIRPRPNLLMPPPQARTRRRPFGGHAATRCRPASQRRRGGGRYAHTRCRRGVHQEHSAPSRSVVR